MDQTYENVHIRFMGVVLGGSIPPPIHPSVLPSYSPTLPPPLLLLSCVVFMGQTYGNVHIRFTGLAWGFHPFLHPSLPPHPSIVMCCFHAPDLWECSYQVYRASVGLPPFIHPSLCHPSYTTNPTKCFRSTF